MIDVFCQKGIRIGRDTPPEFNAMGAVIGGEEKCRTYRSFVGRERAVGKEAGKAFLNIHNPTALCAGICRNYIP